MNILFVASECAPFVKTGGLADVIGAVPKALRQDGADPRVMLPCYPALKPLAASGAPIWHRQDLFGGPARLVATEAEGIELLLLDAPHLYDRGGSIYLDDSGNDWHDNAFRFGALARVAALVAADGVDGWKPDVVHAHDWQAGLVPAYLFQMDRPTPPSVLTIHNIAFQGLFGPELLGPLELNNGLYTPNGLEYYGHLGFLKAGLVYANRITTVSPSYAREIMTPEFGMGLEGVLRARGADVRGILNGIDTEVWDPQIDPHLETTYTARGLKARRANGAALRARFGLDEGRGPLFCVVSRLTRQKGLDVLLDAVPDLVARGGQLAVLGSGDSDLERGYVGAAQAHRGQVGVIIGYDEPLSHLMQGGADAILIPSRFEPCGLTQLYGLRYGCVPVVARTGGLADTVIDANAAAVSAGCATGIQFAPVTEDALRDAIARTCALFEQPRLWSALMRNGMRQVVDWKASAQVYGDLYRSLINY